MSKDEKEYVESIQLQLSLLDTLENNFIDIALINVEDERVTLIKTQSKQNSVQLDAKYSSICKESIQKYVNKNKQQALIQKLSLNQIRFELSKSKEYSVNFCGIVHEQNRYYQVKYIYLFDLEHILMIFKQSDNQYSDVENLRKERAFLDVLCRDYTSVYYYNSQDDALEVLKMGENSNEVHLIGKEIRVVYKYTDEMKRYCENFVVENQKEEFLKVMSPESIIERLSKNARYVYRFESKPNNVGQHYFELQALRIHEEVFDGTAILAFRHIDDIIEAENRALLLENERKIAVEANEMKSRFLSSISHDIRTPINGIQGMLRIADAYGQDMKKQAQCREKLWIASNYLESLVNNVLDMSRLENNAIHLKEEPFNLIDVLMNITSIVDVQVEEQGLHSIVDWKPEYIKHRHLIGSVEGLSRILMNLNSNAIKYNKPHGTIYCRCMEKEVDKDIAWFELVTADTGIGMDEEFLKHAFDPYTQKNNSSLNSMNGVGLGLSIVKQTVSLMHGSISVESKVGKGTRYTILLPFKIEEQKQEKKETLEHISLAGVHALLVEDNNLNMEIAKFCLEQEDIVVTTASNGQEALHCFENSPIGYYDIILMDIMMPIMDGLTATQKIRSLNRIDVQTIPIIAMSANAFEEDVQKSLKAGMNEHLIKPMNASVITNTMKKFLKDKIV